VRRLLRTVVESTIIGPVKDVRIACEDSEDDSEDSEDNEAMKKSI